jgi:PAS domain-containing protein
MNGATTTQAPAAIGKNVGPWSAMLLGVFLSALACFLTFEPEQNRTQKHLEQQARQSAPLIQAELRSYENVIRGLSGLFATQQQVTRDEFRQYIDTLNFRQHYPGVRQVNFSGAPRSANTNSFDISYVADTSDSRVELRTLSNSGKAGTALYSGGQTSVRLLAGNLIINQPVYRAQMPIDTVEQRRSSLIGMLSVELDPSKLTNRLLNENISPKYYSEAQFVAGGDHFSRKMADQGTNSSPRVIIQSPTSDAQKYHSLIPIEIADTFWALKLSTDKSLILLSRNQTLPWVVLLTGLFISVLVSALIYFRTWPFARNHPRVTGAERESRHRDLALIEAQRLAKLGSWTFNLSSQQFFWPAETSIVLGFDTHVPGKSLDQFLRCIHPEDRESVSRTIKSVSERNESADLQFRIILEDGSSRCLHAIAKLITDESESVVHGIVMDISERKFAEQRLQLEHQVVQMTHTVDSLEMTVTQIIETVCRHLGWAGGIFWERQQGDELQSASTLQWTNAPGSIQDFINIRTSSIQDESGIQDQIWQLKNEKMKFDNRGAVLTPDL